MKGYEKTLTLGLLTRIADAFPSVINRSYLLEGEGAEVGMPDASGTPFYDVDFALGYSEFADEVSDPDRYIEFPGVDADLWCRAHGDSMEPLVPDGAIIALKDMGTPTLDAFTRSGVYAIVTADGIRTVKRVRQSKRRGYLRLVPENPDHPVMTVRIDDIVRLYRVVCVVNRLPNRYM